MIEKAIKQWAGGDRMTQLETFTAISPTEVQKLNAWMEDLSPRIIDLKANDNFAIVLSKSGFTQNQINIRFGLLISYK